MIGDNEGIYSEGMGFILPVVFQIFLQNLCHYTLCFFFFNHLYLSVCCQPTALLIAASTDALGMFLLLHCSSMWAKLIFMSGLDPPSADESNIEISKQDHC